MAARNSRQLYKTGFSADQLCRLDDARAEKLREIQLEMLADFMAFAERFGLCWTLSGGSVLGAVRHRGFIPWDDDIDLNMPRADYNRMLDLFSEHMGERYLLCSPERTPGHGLLCAQIKRRDTLFRSFNELSKPDDQCGICLDVFVVENVSDRAIRRKLHGYIALAAGYLSTCRKTRQDYPYMKPYLEPGSPAERGFHKKAVIGGLFRWLPLDRVTRLGVRVYSRCHNQNSTYVSIPAGRAHFFGETQLRADLCEATEVPFEGRTVKIPKGYDRYLTALYGPDYMQLPPEEARERHPLMGISFGEDAPAAERGEGAS